jgi:hypothetical protein
MIEVEHKSEQLQQVALTNGWKSKLIPDIPLDGDVDEIVWNLHCVRDREDLHVQYVGNRLSEATYSFNGDEPAHPQYRNNVVKILEGKPSIQKLKQSVPAEDLIKTRSVPWVKDDPAFLILREVIGREITWVRRIDGVVCTAVVDGHYNTGSKFFRLYIKNDQRFLEWIDVHGFHAVYLDAIIDVS